MTSGGTSAVFRVLLLESPAPCRVFRRAAVAARASPARTSRVIIASLASLRLCLHTKSTFAFSLNTMCQTILLFCAIIWTCSLGGHRGCYSRSVQWKTFEMSTLSVRAPLQATVLDTRSLRVRGVTALDGVRRNLFGCTDREENRRFVERELTRQLELDSQRWGFDFANEKPLPGAQRFAWQLVPASAVPAALRRSPITISTQAPANLPTNTQETRVSSPESSKTQKRITGMFYYSQICLFSTDNQKAFKTRKNIAFSEIAVK